MAQNEVDVNALLKDLNSGGDKATKPKDSKPQGGGWIEEEDNEKPSGFATVKAKESTKKKVTKKTDDGWGKLQQAEPEKPAEIEQIIQTQEKKKEKKLNLAFKNQQAKPTSIPTTDEFFPGLGEKGPEKKKTTQIVPPLLPQPTPIIEKSASGPPRIQNAKKHGTGPNFLPIETKDEPILRQPEVKQVASETKPAGPVKIMNTKKTAAGESFAPIEVKPEPEITEPSPKKEVTAEVTVEKPASRPPGNTWKKPKDEEVSPTDLTNSKFKFEGGPKKFTGGANKISFQRDDAKSEADILREQKEKEIEEKLFEERAKERKEHEERMVRKTEKEKTGFRAEVDKDEERKVSYPKKNFEKREGAEGHHEKNGDRKGEKPVERKISSEKPLVVESLSPVVESKPVVKVEVSGKLSTTNWGDGEIKKVKATQAPTTTVKK